VLVVLLVGAAAGSLVAGAANVPLGDVPASLLHHLGIGDAPATDAIVWGIRLPRTLLAAVAGGALAAGGVALQGLYRNPLADPHLLGIGPGAAIGAALGSLGAGVQGAIAGGAAAGVASALLARRVARRQAADPARFVLAGVALGAVLTAWAGFVVTGSDRTRVPPMEFWLLGSLSGSTWRAFGAMAVIGGFALLGLYAATRTLDLLALGEAEAAHLGVDVDLSGSVISIAVGVMVGGAVGAAGVIGFVGLLVPTLVRPLVGPAHRDLLTSSVLGGGILLIGIDIVARTVFSPIEIPVGLLTTALGGPVFLWLLRRSKALRWV
jgi:iron complex transport system permease protein